jgi:hypothetical protein
LSSFFKGSLISQVNKEKVCLTRFLKARPSLSALSTLADLKEDMDGNILKAVELPAFDGTPESWPTFWLKFQKYAKGLGLYHLLTEDGSKAAKLKDSADFDKNDHQLQTMLVGTLSEGAVHLVEYCESTYDMVQRLQSHYHSSSAASIVFKLDQALDLNYDEDTEMSDHLGKLNALVNQIQSSGDLTIDKLHVVLMLRSIPQNDRWNVVVTNLKAIDEKELTKEKAARLLTERSMELKAKSKTPRTQNSTLTVGNYKNIVCYRYNQKGHISRNCATQHDGERDRTRENERDEGRRDAEKLKPHGRFPAQKQEKIPNYTFHVDPR